MARRRALVPLALAILAIAVVACGNDNDRSQNGIEALTRVGTTWSYTETFSILSTLDVEVEVMDTPHIVIGPRPTVIWVFSYSGGSETAYVYLSGDTVTVVPHSMSPTGLLASLTSQSFVFPLHVGDRWAETTGTEFFRDSTRVVSRLPITLPGGNVEDAWRLDRRATGGYSLLKTVWVVPDAGIVKMVQWKQGMLAIGQSTTYKWDLTGYHRGESGLLSNPLTQVGTVWNYRVTRYPGGPPFPDVETTVLSADGLALDPKPAAIWQTRLTGPATLLSYVYVAGDTVTIVPQLEHHPFLPDTTRYVFPLHPGSRWTGIYGEPMNVTAFKSVDVPAGPFPAYEIDRFVLGPNYRLDEITSIAPDVGIVKLIRMESNPWFENGTTRWWVLSDYHQPPPGTSTGITRPGP